MHSAKRHAGVNAAPPALAAQFTSMARRRAARWGTGRLHQRPAKCNRCQRNSPDPCGYPLLATAGGSWPAGNLRALIRAARPPLPRCPWRERPEAAADYRGAVPTPAALPVAGLGAQVHHGGARHGGGMAHRGVRGWCDRMRMFGRQGLSVRVEDGWYPSGDPPFLCPRRPRWQSCGSGPPERGLGEPQSVSG